MWTQECRDRSNELRHLEGQRFRYSVEYHAEDAWVPAMTIEDIMLELDEQLFLMVRTAATDANKLRSVIYNRAYCTNRNVRVKWVRKRGSRYSVALVFNETMLFALADKEDNE